ncbi:A disintegrin and metalloproteinase with thrombospondin motifs 2-like [Sinocyclocheilus grahami]|uniref:A disintegrin and metalloproteinase with thrombospondin motifs 2-like n=1 Tax=Sinocyclocheilus grahami TaxID=75366 RepID=UPI0007ACABA4|nr:PREDICTED: A disintegrin and metalloproteinase with thrombospondin motifs 2-like [Sinocyclocheilus grahami]
MLRLSLKCSVSCGEGIQQRQVICRPSEGSSGQCDADKPESVSVCKLPPCTGEPSLPSPTRELLDNLTTEEEKPAENTLDKCSVSCGEGIQQRQVICRPSEGSSGQCDADKPESVSVCKLPPCTGEPSLPSPTRELLDNLTTEEEKPAENTLDKVSNEPCLGDKSIFCQMEVLARYCSIPGYQKLCCESCNRRMAFSTLSPDVHPPFSWLPDFTFPPLPQTSPDPTVPPSTAAPLVHTTKAASRRPRLTSSSPKADESTPCPSSLPPDALQIQGSLASTRQTRDSPVT